MYVGENHILVKVEAAEFEKEIKEERNNGNNNRNK